MGQHRLSWWKGILRAKGYNAFVKAGSTANNLPWAGNQVIFSTAASKKHFLNAPAAIGDEVSLFCRRATTTLTAWVVLPTGYSFQRTSNSTGTTHRKAIMNAGNQSLTLVAISTSRVGIKNNVNTVTITTS